MKKTIVLLAAFTMILSSCAVSQNSDFSGADVPKETADMAEQTFQTESFAETDEPVSERGEKKESLFNISEIRICDVGSAKTNMQTYEEIQSEYPDKTILIWQLDPLITPPSARAVNSRLDSLGKEYAVCFKDAPKTYRKSRYNNDVSYSTYGEILTERLEDGEQMDIVDAFAVYNELSMRGYLEPIDGYLSDTAAGRELYSIMPENYWQGCRVNGKIYGVCSYLTLGKRNGCLVNSVLADKYGYDVEKPILEQLDILEQIKKESCDPVMTWKGFSQPSECSTKKYFSNCVAWDSAAESAISILSDEEYKETLRTYFELNKLGLVHTDPIRNSYFIYEQNNQYLPDSKSFEQIYTQSQNSFITVPSYVSSQYGTCIKQSGIGVGISSSSKHKDLAFDLLATAYTDPELNNILCYGENYRDFIHDGIIYLSGNDICRTWVFLNPVISICPGTEPRNLAELWSRSIEAAEVGKDIDFAVDLKDFEDTVDAVRAVTVEMSRELFSDKYADFEEYINDYSKRLNNAGQQAVIDEVNRQYRQTSGGKQ